MGAGVPATPQGIQMDATHFNDSSQTDVDAALTNRGYAIAKDLSDKIKELGGGEKNVKNANGDVTGTAAMDTADYMKGQMEISQITSKFEAVNAANTVNNAKVTDAAKDIKQGVR